VIRLLVLDVDGVLTDGLVRLDEEGRETKTLSFRDLDAVAEARASGVAVALLSGEATPILSVIAGRLGVENVVAGRKDKEAALAEIAAAAGVPLDQVCYVGDSPRDAPALRAAGLGLAPADAADVARSAADETLRADGGRGAVAEAVSIVLARSRD
jgi:YrbI family 3-deoxy-D-manno-octulosonate 8-phosphate phosphatase